MQTLPSSAFRLTALALCLAAVSACSYIQPKWTPPVHEATTPAPREQQGWKDRHASMNERAAKGDANVVFIGDSITQGWEGAGKEVWAERFAPMKAVNLGIGGDRTQHVLWRLQNGNLNGIEPKAAVIMIGTNNVSANSPQEIADGITAIVKYLRQERPKMKILLLAVFPRAEKPDDPARAKIAELNAIAKKQTRGRNVKFLDIGPNFLSPDGTLSKDVMPDFLHLSPEGYKIWANSIQTELEAIAR